jgi:hypothetical protein
MAKANVTPSMKPKWTPQPLPGNEAAFAAFRIVQSCREVTLSGVLGFNWQNVETKLRVHKMWTPEIERKLSLMEAFLVNEEKKVRDENEEMNARTENAAKKPRKIRRRAR